MIAEIFHTNVEYARTNLWDSPSRMDLRDEDVLIGVAFVPHRDCGGTGHFPVPQDYEGSDFCVGCKGTGLEAVSV